MKSENWHIIYRVVIWLLTFVSVDSFFILPTKVSERAWVNSLVWVLPPLTIATTLIIFAPARYLGYTVIAMIPITVLAVMFGFKRNIQYRVREAVSWRSNEMNNPLEYWFSTWFH